MKSLENYAHARKIEIEHLVICHACGHPWEKHLTGICLHERGDNYESGYAPMAMGPCGCMARLSERKRPTVIGWFNILRGHGYPLWKAFHFALFLNDWM